MQPVILLSGYYATRYPIIWVLCNPLSYYLGTMQPIILLSGTMQPVILLSGYYATHYSIIWVLCNLLFVVFWVLHVPISYGCGTT